MPIKTTRYKKTITSTIVRRKTVTARRRRDVGADVTAEPWQPVSVGTSPLEQENETGSHALFARHLCPVCPKGSKVLPSGTKNNGGGNYKFCCAARKTTTIIVNKTLTKRKTVIRTVTAARVGCCHKKSGLGRLLFAEDFRIGRWIFIGGATHHRFPAFSLTSAHVNQTESYNDGSCLVW